MQEGKYENWWCVDTHICKSHILLLLLSARASTRELKCAIVTLVATWSCRTCNLDKRAERVYIPLSNSHPSQTLLLQALKVRACAGAPAGDHFCFVWDEVHRQFIPVTVTTTSRAHLRTHTHTCACRYSFIDICRAWHVECALCMETRKHLDSCVRIFITYAHAFTDGARKRPHKRTREVCNVCEKDLNLIHVMSFTDCLQMSVGTQL
jgi:hypothetical protein